MITHFMNKYCLVSFLFFAFQVRSELNFNQQSIELNSSYYNSINTFDLDNDGDIDIYSLSGGKFKWFENQEGEFELNSIEINTDEFLRLIKIDSNTIDFWSVNYSDNSASTLSIYTENNNYNKVELITINNDEDSYNTFFVGDFNGDQHVDFVVVNLNLADVNGYNEASIKYYYNSGSNQFEINEAEDKIFVPVSNKGYYYFLVLDVNNDDKDDLVYLSHYEQDFGTLYYQKSSLNNSYELLMIVDEVTQSEVYDFQYSSMDGDGLIDVINLGWEFTVYQQIDDSFFENTIELKDYSSDVKLFFEDYDGDNDYDIISFPANGDRGYSYVYENDNGNYSNFIEMGYIENQHSGFQTLSKPGNNLMTFTSLNWIYDSPNRIWVYKYQNNQLQSKQISNKFINITGVEAADLTNNDLLDLVAFDAYSTEIVGFMQSTEYQFYRKELLKLNRFPKAIKLNDENGDGVLDLLIVSSDSENSYFDKYLNDGLNNFSLNESILLPRHIFRQYAETKLIDINNDGKMDITTSDFLAIDLGWFMNQSGSFEYQALVDVRPINYPELAYDFNDLDGDGDLDVVYSVLYFCHFSCSGETSYALFDEQTNSFTNVTAINAGAISFESVFIENLAEVENNEILLSYKNSSNQVYRQVFSLQNGELVEIDDPLDPDLYVSIPHDINGDGVVDFLYWNGNSYQFLTSLLGFNWSAESSSGLEFRAYNPFVFNDIDGNGEIDFVTQSGGSLIVTFQGDLIQGAGSAAVSVNVNQAWAMLLLVFGVLFIFGINQTRQRNKLNKKL